MNLSEKQLQRAASILAVIALLIVALILVVSLRSWMVARAEPPASHVVYYFTQPLDLTGWAPMTLATRELIAAGKMGHVEYQELPSLIGVERDTANPRHGEIIDHQYLAWWRFAPSANTD